MTKYTSIEDSKEVVKTVFTHVVLDKNDINKSTAIPSSYDYVVFIGRDIDYGDVFKAWNKEDENCFAIYFGKKGDEFK